ASAAARRCSTGRASLAASLSGGRRRRRRGCRGCRGGVSRRVVHGLGERLQTLTVLRIHRLGTPQRRFLRQVMRGRVFGDVWILPLEVAWNLAPLHLTLFDVITRPEGAKVWVR